MTEISHAKATPSKQVRNVLQYSERFKRPFNPKGKAKETNLVESIRIKGKNALNLLHVNRRIAQ